MAASPSAQVLLRPPSARDEAEVVAAVRRSRALHRGLATPPADAATYEAWLRRSRRRNVRTFLVCRRQDGAVAGAIAFSQIFHGGFRSAYLGYWAVLPHAGKGHMKEGLALALDHAFGPLRLHRVEANVQPHNERSLHLLRALGFRLEGYSPRYLQVAGRWRDHLRLALLAEEWAGRPVRRRRAP